MAKDCCFKGVGKIYIRPYVEVCTIPPTLKTEGFTFIGNAEKFDIVLDQSEQSVKDYTTTGGGKDCTLTTIDAIKLEMTINCFSKENLALGLFGTKVNQPAGSVVGYNSLNNTKVFSKDMLINLPFVGPYTGVVVANNVGAAVYVAGVDYVVTTGGIFIPATSGIPLNAVLKIDYAYPAQSSVEIGTNSGSFYEIYFDGTNQSDNVPAVRHLYKVKAGPADKITTISDEFSKFDVTFEVLKDGCVLTPGLSQYGVLR